ncbi:hypothetical protein JF781_10260 [Mycobacterium sp. WUMAC-067]|uniref:hypothetical protein n=1 Tax=unclassified Mycobacterium TaxID=2642494 RepID=UPI001CD9E2FD|nr:MULTISPECIES: hypothetical protein [unclassified Mycobacterium]MCA2242743.1 hypothetical protein [Mycobacterium sp. WUMAC-067]MCA2315168.1 hypothetical protein [Mycobacterium sp. WUMAC-025]
MPDDKDPASPGTEAFVPDFSDDDDEAEDTGTQSWVPDFDSDSGEETEEAEDTGGRPAGTEPESEEPEPEVPAGPVGPVQSVTVPGRYLYVKWWKLALLLLGVWAPAAVVGLGLFSWWYNSVDKTPALFAVLVYVSLCVVGAVMLAMVHGRPLVSALSVAVLSGPFAAVAGAAPLHGYYYCERVGHCLVGVIPY